MVARFPVVDVTHWAVDLFEADGSEEKVWLIESDSQRRALFKPNLRNDTAEKADHWPEKLTSEIAGLLGVPRADIDLAVRAGHRGCISYNVKPADWQLQPGYVLLTDSTGQVHDPRARLHEGHTLENIRRALRNYGPPPDFTGPDAFGAFDVFVGYLVFDGRRARVGGVPEEGDCLEVRRVP
ncbi:hypothetical protein JOL79_27535 [Microbispora sp. RL4-1S]|uniref:Uncharacterized protein n=1 Tax=Microbispora oryzae TaxID=2806554 RepID=A0A940WUR2_9ACTN|nr:hypothetical protein [Microbispora oryzae]MBP2707541.1 hypothetical protein [Microbispora oryzae]